MRSDLAKLSTRAWLLIVLPAILMAYPVARIVVPAVIHAVVPDVVRSVLSYL